MHVQDELQSLLDEQELIIMWIGSTFMKSKHLDAELAQQAENTVDHHEEANTALQDAVYSFNAATSTILQTRTQSYAACFLLLIFPHTYRFPEEELNLPPPEEFYTNHSTDDKIQSSLQSGDILRFVKNAVSEERIRRKQFLSFLDLPPFIVSRSLSEKEHAEATLIEKEEEIHQQEAIARAFAEYLQSVKEVCIVVLILLTLPSH